MSETIRRRQIILIDADFIQFSDVLITDSQYTEEEYVDKVGWGHCTYTDAMKLARAGRVKQLVFFHHDPSHNDAFLQEKEAECQAAMNGYRIPSRFAREGLEISL